VEVGLEDPVADDDGALRRHSLVVDRERPARAGKELARAGIGEGDALARDALADLPRGDGARLDEVRLDRVPDGLVRQEADERGGEEHFRAST
jgi:hypothetical protein